MGFLDRFRSRYGQKKKKTSAPKHAVKDSDAKKKQFMAVGAADQPKQESPATAKKDAAPKKETSAPKKNTITGTAPRILIRPLVTEKLTLQTGTYAFEVNPRANRSQVKAAIHQLYGVRPTRVNIITLPGKAVRYGRTSGHTKFWKKAMVTLPAGKTIEVFE